MTEALSAHEARIVALVAAGWRNHVIAGRLGVTTEAVESALGRVYAKYGLDVEPDLDKRVCLALRANGSQSAVTGGPGGSGGFAVRPAGRPGQV